MRTQFKLKDGDRTATLDEAGPADYDLMFVAMTAVAMGTDEFRRQVCELAGINPYTITDGMPETTE